MCRVQVYSHWHWRSFVFICALAFSRTQGTACPSEFDVLREGAYGMPAAHVRVASGSAHRRRNRLF